MTEKTEISQFIILWVPPIILIILGVLMIVFKKALGNIYYRITQFYGRLYKNEKGEPWGRFKTLTPNYFTLKNEDRKEHQKRIFFSGIMAIIMGLFLMMIIKWIVLT